MRRTQSFLLHNPRRTVVLPGDYIKRSTPCDSDPDSLWALEPRLDSPSNILTKPKEAWPRSQDILSVDHAVRITNTTDSPIHSRCQIRRVRPVDSVDSTCTPSAVPPPPTCLKPFSQNVILDPDARLPQVIRDKFFAEMEDSVVRSISASDDLAGSVRMPFTSRAAWQATQQECSLLRQTHSHLSQGTPPSKKATKVTDVKRYLKDVVIAADGLLVVRDTRERIVVPRSVLDGLLVALHIQFPHPSKFQTKRLFSKYFFALDIDKAIDAVSSSCHFCQSVKTIPSHLQPQSTSDAPTTIGVSFAADVVRHYRQCIVVMRETISSYTLTSIIESEKHEDLRNAIMVLCSELRSLCDGGVTVRVDPAPGFVALTNDRMLQFHGITLDVGRIKNPNKNPVAERAIEELGLELLSLNPEGGPMSKVTLALATANINSRIRRDGLSAREVWTHW